MVSHIRAFVRVRPLLPREFAQSISEAVSVYEVLINCQEAFGYNSCGGNCDTPHFLLGIMFRIKE